MLEVKNISAGYGNIQVLWDISFTVKEAEIMALVGANGAGKSTLLKTLSGLLPPTSGEATFLGTRIDHMPSNQIVELGLSHIPEGRNIFTEMSVRENLELGAFPRPSWAKREETLETVYNIFPILKEREKQRASTLSGGEQQMLAMGRGLMSRPKMCIIDEPSNGLAPKLVLEVFQIVKSLRDQGITILLVEQNVKYTLEIADCACVLENGRIVLEGTCQTLLDMDHIKKSYLGL